MGRRPWLNPGRMFCARDKHGPETLDDQLREIGAAHKLGHSLTRDEALRLLMLGQNDREFASLCSRCGIELFHGIWELRTSIGAVFRISNLTQLPRPISTITSSTVAVTLAQDVGGEAQVSRGEELASAQEWTEESIKAFLQEVDQLRMSTFDNTQTVKQRIRALVEERGLTMAEYGRWQKQAIEGRQSFSRLRRRSDKKPVAKPKSQPVVTVAMKPKEVHVTVNVPIRPKDGASDIEMQKWRDDCVAYVDKRLADRDKLSHALGRCGINISDYQAWKEDKERRGCDAALAAAPAPSVASAVDDADADDVTEQPQRPRRAPKLSAERAEAIAKIQVTLMNVRTKIEALCTQIRQGGVTEAPLFVWADEFFGVGDRWQEDLPPSDLSSATPLAMDGTLRKLAGETAHALRQLAQAASQHQQSMIARAAKRFARSIDDALFPKRRKSMAIGQLV